MSTRSLSRAALLACALWLGACASPHGSSQAYLHAARARADTLALMSKADELFANHAAEIAQVDAQLEAAYRHEQTRGRQNAKTIAMWDTLLHRDAARPQSGIYPRFVAQWQARGTLQPAYINFKKQNVAAAFDEILALESARAR